MKKYILFDHDGVLVDTEFWYYKAGERALADVGLTLDKDQYLWDMKRHIRQFMDFVLVREDYERAKPHPEPYLSGLKRFGAVREETLVVEDSPRGLMSAVAAGVDCAIVHNDFVQSADFSEASYRIGALIELRDIVVGETVLSD